MECEALVFKRNKNNNDHENSFSSMSLNIIIKKRVFFIVRFYCFGSPTL